MKKSEKFKSHCRTFLHFVFLKLQLYGCLLSPPTLAIVTSCFQHFRCATLTCRLSFSCGISILNLWTGSKSCCWLSCCCCCCKEVGCCIPGWGIAPPDCCCEAILTGYKRQTPEEVFNIRFADFQSKSVSGTILFLNLKILHSPIYLSFLGLGGWLDRKKDIKG